MLGNSVVVVVVVVVLHTLPRAILLAMITMRKSTRGFSFLSYEYGAPLGGPNRSSATIEIHLYLYSVGADTL